MNHSNIKIGIRKKMTSKFEKIFEQLADFHTLSGYDGWMIGACVYEQREAAGERVSGTEFGCGNDLTVVQNQNIKIQNSCKSGIVRKTSSFAVMRNQMEEDGILYQLELHVIKPEVQGEDISRQVVIEENTDTGVGKSISFTHSDILRFVDAVGDTNSIHRTAHAVVPGLLMVERMLDMWMRKQLETEADVELKAGMKNEMQAGVQVETQNEMQAGTQTGTSDSGTFICRFRFEKPVYVDEKLQIQARTERGKQIYECKREDKEIVWNMRIL